METMTDGAARSILGRMTLRNTTLNSFETRADVRRRASPRSTVGSSGIHELSVGPGAPLGLTKSTAPAFNFPLVDQSGHTVFYQIIVDAPEFKKLKNREIIPAYGNNICSDKTVVPCDEGFNSLGSIELKLAWKLLTPDETKSGRFLQETASIADATGSSLREVGLVGIHIINHTSTQPEWIWSTFEQIDNLQPHRLANGTMARPSFFMAHCPAGRCPPENCPPAVGQSSQITRVHAIDEDTAALNSKIRKMFATDGSVLQYYELIGTQTSVLGKSILLQPNLRNSVIEPYVVNNPRCRKVGNVGERSSCIACHAFVQKPPPTPVQGAVSSLPAKGCQDDASCSFLAAQALHTSR
jgi:hypothetical protein